jgi:hypothetical protein
MTKNNKTKENKMKKYTNSDKERIENYFQYIQLQINLLTKKGNGKRIHFLDYSNNSINFSINQIQKTLDKLK